MKNLTWQNPEQLFVAQELINKVKSKCCGIKVKDILPFTLTQDKSNFISALYDKILTGVKRKGRGNKIDGTYKKSIEIFNNEVKYVIDLINRNAVPTATDIFNNYFRDEEDRKLKITLEYDNNKDKIPQADKSYWLRLGYRYQSVFKAGASTIKKLSTSYEVLQPSIKLKVEELLDDNVTYDPIDKPQTHFNEAKLTAIALSIRFALLNTVDLGDGRFLALDDMLISLDMSNRMKVIKYLLNQVAPTYKLYIFTHDRLFYHTLKRIIETQYKKSEWILGGIYVNDLKNPIEPDFRNEAVDKITDAYKAYACHDYFLCGILLRTKCEECLKELLPDSYRWRVKDGQTIEKTLDEQILSIKEFCEKENLDYTPFESLKVYKDLFLNTTAHNDITSPFYRNEIKSCLTAIEQLSKICRAKEIRCKQDFYFEFHTPDGKTCCVSMRRREPIRLLEYDGQQRISNYNKCEIRKIIVDETEIVLNEGFESINQAYIYVCQHYDCPSNLVLLDILKDRNGYLKDYI